MPKKGEANRMSLQQAQRYQNLLALGPKQWEKKVEGALRANGWKFFHDRDRPTRDKRILKARMAGFPDYLAWKHFEDPHVEIMRATGYFNLDFTAFLFVECKSGKGTTSKKQEEILDAAKKCPGTASIVARPSNYEELIKILGGKG